MCDAVGGVGADNLAGGGFDLGEGIIDGDAVVSSLHHGDVVTVVAEDDHPGGSHLAGQVADGGGLAGPGGENLEVAFALVKDVMIEHHLAGADSSLEVGGDGLEHGILVQGKDQQGLILAMAVAAVIK